MTKLPIRYSDYFAQAVQKMRGDGLLLVSSGADNEPNVMTIGWGAVGAIWGRPVFIVLVRPTRHTYSRLEQVGDFTVNVPPPELAAAANLCGSVSGRDHDKFKEAGLTLVPAKQVRAPIIDECVVHYECRTIHKNDVAPDTLAQAVLDDAYASGNFHRVYFGEIVAAYADKNALQRLQEPTAGAFAISKP